MRSIWLQIKAGIQASSGFITHLRPDGCLAYLLKMPATFHGSSPISSVCALPSDLSSMAYENYKVGCNTFAVFQRVKKKLKKGEDVRDRILSMMNLNPCLKMQRTTQNQ